MLLWFMPRDKLRLLTPEDQMSTYTFNKHEDVDFASLPVQHFDGRSL